MTNFNIYTEFLLHNITNINKYTLCSYSLISIKLLYCIIKNILDNFILLYEMLINSERYIMVIYYNGVNDKNWLIN